jgi:hypothetical protein
VFVLSAAVIALELALMRWLAIARWHHFSYLVISTALLGFGAAGTLLTFAGAWLGRRFVLSATALTLLFAVCATASLRAAEALPLDARYVLYSGRQAALMLLYHLLLLVPFLFAATAIGLALMHFRGRVHLVYAANLAGSGAGSAAALGLMFLLPAERLPHAVACMGAAAALLWALSGAGPGAWRRAGAALLVGAALVGEALWMPLSMRMDPYKMLSVLRRLEAEGNAQHLATRHSPRARLDVYDSPLLHQTMFAGLTATAPPPPQLAVLADGDLAATVFDIRSPEQAPILDCTPMALPYRFLEHPRVLLLGEAGGANVWLARRHGAAHVTVVQPNPQLVELMRGPLAERGGRVLLSPDVSVETIEPRTFLERTRDRFDLVQVVGAEGMSAAGILSLREEFLLTQEGMALCIERLSDRGVVAVTRGTQAPPRDNVKLFATLRAALGSLGVSNPGAHLVQARNYLAACTMAFRTPPDTSQCRALTAAASELALDIEWAPCEGVRYGDQVNEVEGPPGKPYSWFHEAALAILSPEREEFFRHWAYNVRPATDDSPYFHDFFRWRSLPLFMRVYGQEWLRRAELGYVVLVLALAEAVVAGGALILLPLLWLRRRGAASGRAAVGAYFVLLGLAYMMLEMVCLLKFTHFLGDPVYATAGVLCSFLAFSGLGSALSRRLAARPRRAIRVAAAGVAAMSLLYAFGLGWMFRLLIGWPLAARLAASVLLTAPAAFLMGWPFPNGLALVERGDPRLVPWAWGANGFASVAAAPLAVLIAIGGGFRLVILLAGGAYLLAALVSAGLPEDQPHEAAEHC